MVHQPIERHFELVLTIVESDAVFRRDQFERPGIVWLVSRQLMEMLLKPLSAPRPGFEPRSDSKDIPTHPIQGIPQDCPRYKRRFIGPLSVDKPVDLINEHRLVPIENRPIDEIESLILFLGRRVCVSTKIEHISCPRAILQLILGEINVNQWTFPFNQGRSAAIEDRHGGVTIGTLSQLSRLDVEEINQLTDVARAEQRIVAPQKWLHDRFNFRWSLSAPGKRRSMSH